MANTLSRLFVRIGADTSDFQKSMNNVQKSMRNTGQSMKNIGGTMTKAITVPLVGLGAAVTKTTMDFNKQMDRVGAIAGASAADFEILEDAAREMGRSTTFSASEAAEGMEYLAMAGWETEEMASGLEPVLRMAEAAQMDLGQAADITSDLMSAFGYEAEEVAEMTDILSAVSTSANTDIEQLGQAMAYAGPAANAAGVSLEEASAMAGMFADSGIKGSKAGTTLRAMLTDLQGAAGKSIEGIGDMSDIIYDSEGNMRGMTEILGDLEYAMQDMTAQQRDQASSAIFGTRAMAGFDIMMREGTEQLGDFTNELENSEGATNSLAEQMVDNLAGELTELKSAFEGLMLDLGQVLVPIIRESVIPMIQNFVEFLGGLTQAFGNLPSGVQKAVIAFAAALAAAGPVLLIVGQMLIAFSGLMPVITAVGGVLGGLALGPIAAVIAAVAGVIAIWKNWDTIVNFVKWFGGAIMNIISPLTDGIANAFRNMTNTVKSVFQSMWNGIRTILNWIIGAANKMIAGLNQISVSVPDWVPGFGGREFKVEVSKIPQLAAGGNIRSGGAAIVGDAGPELLDLPTGARVTPLDQAGGTNITNQFDISEMNVRDDQDIKKIAKELDNLQKRKNRRVGV